MKKQLNSLHRDFSTGTPLTVSSELLSEFLQSSQKRGIAIARIEALDGNGQIASFLGNEAGPNANIPTVGSFLFQYDDVITQDALETSYRYFREVLALPPINDVVEYHVWKA